MASTTNDWERDWRRTIAEQIKDVSEQMGNATAANQQTAVILERVQGKLAEHDADIKDLRERPAGLRQNVSAYGGCLYLVIAAGIALMSLLVTVGIALMSLLISAGGDIIAIYMALHR